MQEKLSVKDKLLRYSGMKGYKKTQFCAFIGVSASFFTIDRGFSTDILQLILNKCSDLNADWLLRDEGEMLRNDETKATLIEHCDEKDAMIEYLKEQLNKQTELSQSLIQMINIKNK